MRARFATMLVAAAAAHAAHGDAVPVGRLPDDVVPLSYSLHLRIDPAAARFSGDARIRVRILKTTDHIWLHARDLDVVRSEVVDASGAHHAAKFQAADRSGVARLDLGGALAPQEADLAFEYGAPFNARLQGLYKVTVGGDAYVVSQMEAVSARRAFPGFDEPRFKTPFDIALTVPEGVVAVSNTLARRQSDAGGGFKTIQFQRTRPLPTYLVAFAVGPWDVVDAPPIPGNGIRRQALPLRALGPRGTASQLHWILGQAPAIVAFFEDYTRQPFPFDKLDLLGAPDFSAGAMENAGLIVFRDALLRLDASSPAGMSRASFDVSAHEIAHQWFGDLVTVPWWNDIWLNEAFASWAQGKATPALQPGFRGELNRLEGTFNAMAGDSLLSARRIRQPVADQDDIENAFDGITYQKGAAVLRMFEHWIGAGRYREAMRSYLSAHAYGSGSSDDLIAMIAKVGGKGDVLARAMRSFLDQPGIPLLHTSLSCRAGKPSLDVSQSRYLPYGVLSRDRLRWLVPFCVRLGNGERSRSQCFLLDRQRAAFPVAGPCPAWYLPNAGASGYYRYSMAARDLDALNRHAAALTPEEQMIRADALRSAFAHGDLDPAAVLDAMPALATADLPQVAFMLSGNLAWMREHLASDATRPVLDAYAAQLFAPRLAALGYRHRAGEPETTSRLRQRLAAFLAFDVRDAAVRRELAATGRNALGLGGSAGVDLQRADPDLRGFALKAAVQDGGADAFDAVLGELARTHATQARYELVSALGATRDPVLAERVRALGLTPAIAVGELSRLYGAQAAEPENRAAFWSWYRTHFDALLARYPDAYQRSLPGLAAAGRCSDADAETLRSWFAPHVADVTGGRRALAQALEGITQCSALRAHVGSATLARWAEAHAAH